MIAIDGYGLLVVVKGLAFSETLGYWVLPTDPPQWVIRKRAGGLEELRSFVDNAEDGEHPAEYTPARPEDKEAITLC